MKTKEEKNEVGHVEVEGVKSFDLTETPTEIPWSRKLKWLSYLLWGGALLLCFEHIWHGEVVPFFPFLTAMSDPGAWGVMVCAVDSMLKRALKMPRMTA